jgi:hypothetical protein
LTFSEASPGWTRLTATLLDLLATEADLLAEGAELEKTRPPHSANIVSPPKFAPPPRQISEAARELLEDLAPDRLPPHDREQLWSSAWAERAHALGTKLSALQEAIQEVRNKLTAEHARASRLFCADKVPTYAEHAKAVVDSMVALARAYRAHEGFLANLTAQGCNAAFLQLIRVDLIERVVSGDTYSPLSEIAEAARYGGHHDASDALAELRNPPESPAEDTTFSHAKAKYAEAEARRQAVNNRPSGVIRSRRSRPTDDEAATV